MPDVATTTVDGATADALAAELGLPEVHVFEEVESTMDVASALGDRGAPAGTLVIAGAQHAGRGRGGKRWESPPGGLWLTLLERPNDVSALPVLPLRVGLRMAQVLERWTAVPIQLKWPNDLFASGAKLAGILIEARWREQRLDWVAIGIGINLTPPGNVPAAHLTSAPARRAVLAELVPAVRAAASARGLLTAAELDAFTRRDLARGRRCRAPAAGVVSGIAESGELIVETPGGRERYLTGSLEFDER